MAGNACSTAACSTVGLRSEEHTSESSHEWISYAVFCLKKKKQVEDAMARAIERTLAHVAKENLLLCDIGQTAIRARTDYLRDISMRPSHPINLMLPTPAADLANIAPTMPVEF